MKVLISGTGFAGEGHADAFRGAGAEIVGIVGRTESVVHKVANKKGIPIAAPTGRKPCKYANRISYLLAHRAVHTSHL